MLSVKSLKTTRGKVKLLHPDYTTSEGSESSFDHQDNESSDCHQSELTRVFPLLERGDEIPGSSSSAEQSLDPNWLQVWTLKELTEMQESDHNISAILE